MGIDNIPTIIGTSNSQQQDGLVLGATAPPKANAVNSSNTVDVCYKGTDRCLSVQKSLGNNFTRATEIEYSPGTSATSAYITINNLQNNCTIIKLLSDPKIPQNTQDIFIAEKEVRGTLYACNELMGQNLMNEFTPDGQAAVIDASAAIIAAQQSSAFKARAGMPAEILQNISEIHRPLQISDCLLQKTILQISAAGYTNSLSQSDRNILNASSNNC